MNIIIRNETKDDYKKSENLTREAFWNVYRPGCTEHFVLYKFRESKNYIPELSFVMEKDGEMIGHVMYAHSHIKSYDGKTIPIMTFGPISIHPDFKRKGYGKILLDCALNEARKMGVGAICMEGNIDFYGKCGFVVASTRDIHYYAEPREETVPYFLLNELKEGFLNGISGVYETPKGYFVDDADVEEFDRKFPPKEKLKLPGQLFD